MADVIFKPILPKPMDLQVFQRETLKQFKREAKEATKLFKQTSSTWKDKPKFENTLKVGRNVVLTVFTFNKAYFFVNIGTRIRWAVMTSDFKAKSSPRSFLSRQGRGRPVIIGRRAMQKRNIKPRPGIKAREFDKEIAKRRRVRFQSDMQKAVDRAAKGFFPK